MSQKNNLLRKRRSLKEEEVHPKPKKKREIPTKKASWPHKKIKNKK
jgi:hypothetical protein